LVDQFLLESRCVWYTRLETALRKVYRRPLAFATSLTEGEKTKRKIQNITRCQEKSGILFGDELSSADNCNSTGSLNIGFCAG